MSHFPLDVLFRMLVPFTTFRFRNEIILPHAACSYAKKRNDVISLPSHWSITSGQATLERTVIST